MKLKLKILITFKNLSTDIPYVHLKEKYERAVSANQQNVEAICISSYSKRLKEVNARYVNLKFIDDKHFIFFSNYESPKSRDFESHDQITALFYWSSIDTQIRMKANIEKTSSDYNQQYFSPRDINKNALAISSKQSEKIDSYEDVQRNYKKSLNNDDLSACPDYWGGFKFKPYYFEFWEGHKSRLNKREIFQLDNNDWIKYFLQP